MENKKIEIDSWAGLCGHLAGGLMANTRFAETYLKSESSSLDRIYLELITNSLRDLLNEYEEHRKNVIR